MRDDTRNTLSLYFINPFASQYTAYLHFFAEGDNIRLRIGAQSAGGTKICR
jgi:hypothetical protein